MTVRAKQGGYSTWGELRGHLIELYGETPHPQTEQEIIDAYEQHPDALEKAAFNVAHDVTAGNARSGWGVLRSRASAINQPISNPTRSTSLDREKAIARAEQWMRAAGLHFDDEGELLLELFSEGKRLRDYAQVDLQELEPRIYTLAPTRGDTALADRMLALWNELHPTSIRMNQEAQEAANKWKLQHTSTSASSEPKHQSESASTKTATSATTAESADSARPNANGLKPSSPSSPSPKPPAQPTGTSYAESSSTAASTSHSTTTTPSSHSTALSPASTPEPTNDDLPI